MKKLIVLLLLSFWMIPPVSFAQGQKKCTLEGSVTTYGTNEPVSAASVIIKELNVWGFSDDKGLFKISDIIPGNYTLEAYVLGYQKVTMPVTITKDITGFKFQMKEENLTLDNVVVTAKKGGSMNSSSKVEKAAIEHVQASSLADVMQLMPGNIIANPTLTKNNSVTIRSIADMGSNNERGVGLMINGSRVSNDATMTLTDPGEQTTTKTTQTLDFRNYSTDNIESVEVLKGVLSAEYGNVTSGAILVTTKAGVTPFEVRVKTDPNTKAFAVSKGFSVGKDAGNVNIDADYARAFKNWVSPIDIFDRTTLGVTYSNTFNADKKPFRFNARISGYISKNNVNSDPDVSKLDFTKINNRSLSVSVYGNWLINKPWITSLNYNLSGTYQNNYTKKLTVSSELPLPTTNVLVDGIGVGYYTDASNEEYYRCEEIPVYANAKISGNLNKKIKNVFSKTVLGFEANTEGNNGRGIYYTSGTPQYYRPREYKDVPYLSDISLFLEEKLTIPIYDKTSLELTAGVRANKMVIEGYNYDPTFEPRFNGKYTIIPSKREGAVRSLALRGGWGIMERLPSIVLLYPSPRYLDVPLFQYRSSTEQLAVIQTTVIDDKLSYNLKPAKTTNSEVGVDFNIFGIEGALTYFKENLKDGISSNSSYLSESYDYYKTISSQTASPKFENGRVWAKNELGVYEQVEYSTQQLFKGYSRPDNRANINKWGIEYDLDFGKINAINTSVIINGSYITSESSVGGLEYSYSSVADPIDPHQKLPYVAIFEGNNAFSVGSIKERFSTNINLVAHIPSIRMIVSLITQCVWMNNTRNIYDEDNIYALSTNGEPVYGDYNGKNNNERLYRTPVAYMGHDGIVRPFSDYWTTTDPNLKTRLNALILSNDQSYYFKEQGYDPYFMANIRVTKEIGKLASLSFYANNFTNSTPILKDKARPNADGVRVNTPIYFGAELKLTF